MKNNKAFAFPTAPTQGLNVNRKSPLKNVDIKSKSSPSAWLMVTLITNTRQLELRGLLGQFVDYSLELTTGLLS